MATDPTLGVALRALRNTLNVEFPDLSPARYKELFTESLNDAATQADALLAERDRLAEDAFFAGMHHFVGGSQSELADRIVAAERERDACIARYDELVAVTNTKDANAAEAYRRIVADRDRLRGALTKIVHQKEGPLNTYRGAYAIAKEALGDPIPCDCKGPIHEAPCEFARLIRG